MEIEIVRQRVWWTDTMAEDLGTRELGMVRSQRLDEVSFDIFSLVPSTSMISVFRFHHLLN